MKTSTLAALSLTGILALSGCGSTGADANTISGKAVDPYVADATVCLADDTLQCYSGEATAKTGADGAYTLTVSEARYGEDNWIVVRNGHDVETNATVNLLVAEHEANADEQHITPLTTLVAAVMQDKASGVNTTREQIEQDVAEAIGVDKEDINSDVVARAEQNGTKAPLIAAVKLGNAADAYDGNATDANATWTFYRAVAQNLGDDLNAAIRGAASGAGAAVEGVVQDILDAVDRHQDDNTSTMASQAAKANTNPRPQP
jgi:hypothetical protein